MNSLQQPTWRHIPSAWTIRQRELRDKHAEVIRGVEAGETYTVTRRGVAVALLVPVRAAIDLRCDRPRKKRLIYAEQPRVPTSTQTPPVRGKSVRAL